MPKLATRKIPHVEIKRKLPAYLAGDDADSCFISVEAKVAGPVNTEYSTYLEELLLAAKVRIKKTESIEDVEDRVRSDNEDSTAIIKKKFEALYETCVVEWSTNILDLETGKPLEPNKENFMTLVEVKQHEIGVFMLELEKRLIAEGNDLLKKTKEDLGN